MAHHYKNAISATGCGLPAIYVCISNVLFRLALKLPLHQLSIRRNFNVAIAGWLSSSTYRQGRLTHRDAPAARQCPCCRFVVSDVRHLLGITLQHAALLTTNATSPFRLRILFNAQNFHSTSPPSVRYSPDRISPT